ncbi:arylsulfatase [Bacteroidota bacterium]
MTRVLLVLIIWGFVSCKYINKTDPHEITETPIRSPNVIFIMADDLGYGDLGCYGQKEILTPNIDQLASEGIRFTNCYAGSTVCAPSRNVLMTGQHTGHTTVRGNMSNFGGVPPQGRVPLKNEEITVAEIFKSAGYVTGITGKWGLGEPNTTGTPNKQGFDEWFGYLNQRNAHTYYPPYLWKNEEKMILDGNADGKMGQYTHDMFTEFAVEFISDHKDKPFFLYIPYTIPHVKYEILDIAPYHDKEWTDDEKVHAAMITRMDKDVGRIMNMLQEFDLNKHTLIFFCSDNGAYLRHEGRFDSSGKLRGRKTEMYEGGIRTPMIIRWTDNIDPGTVSHFPWYFADFLPTMAELTGRPEPENLDGMSILHEILSTNVLNDNRFICWELLTDDFRQAIRWKNWKGVKNGLDQPWELYDLSVDEGEQNNIADNHPDIIMNFEEYIKNNRTESVLWPSGL